MMDNPTLGVREDQTSPATLDRIAYTSKSGVVTVSHHFADVLALRVHTLNCNADWTSHDRCELCVAVSLHPIPREGATAAQSWSRHLVRWERSTMATPAAAIVRRGTTANAAGWAASFTRWGGSTRGNRDLGGIAPCLLQRPA